MVESQKQCVILLIETAKPVIDPTSNLKIIRYELTVGAFCKRVSPYFRHHFRPMFGRLATESGMVSNETAHLDQGPGGALETAGGPVTILS